MRVAIYCRVSTERQENEGYSLEAQLAALRAYAKQRGWVVFDEYIDSITGGTDDRPALQRMLHDARAGHFARVLAVKLDRFYRELRLQLNTVHELDQCGVTFISTSEGLDTSTEMGRFGLQILGAFAEQERRAIGGRISDVRQRRAAQGYWSCGRVRFGYRFDKTEKALLIDEGEAQAVRFLFEHYLDGRGLIRLAELANKELIIPPHLGKRSQAAWTQSAVYNVLIHPAYRGGPNAEWPFNTPAIVPVEVWGKVQRRLAANKRFRPSTTTREFAGLLRCGVCGHAVNLRVGYSHGNRAVYECPSRGKRMHLDGSPRCTLPRRDAADLEAALSEQVQALFDDPELRRQHITATITGLEKEAKDFERRLKPLRAEADRVIADMEIVDAMFQMRRLDASSYKARMAGLQARQRELEKQHEGADPLLFREYKLKLLHLEFARKFNDEKVLAALPQIKAELFARLDETVKATGAPAFHRDLQPTARQIMTAWGMTAWVFPDRIELKAALQTGKPGFVPAYRNGNALPLPLSVTIPLPAGKGVRHG